MNINTYQKEHKSLGHPLATGSLCNNIKMIWENHGINYRYSLRALKIFLSNLVLLPFRAYEKLKWDKKIEETVIAEPPIFILGHWRCGTTHLHNLLTQDPHFGYVSTLQAFAPDICIETKILLPVFKKLLPKKRPFDNMLMSLDLPQEEEYATANLCRLSFYYGYFFPRKMNSIFHQLLFQKASDKIIDQWKDVYLKIFKKATLIMNGKPLVIKNPMNMVRIPLLLEMFPGAKFIHIYRNPYLIFYSTVFTFKTMIHSYGLKKITDREIEENVLQFYSKMMRRFWETKDLIPQENFTEVSFEELEKAPLTVMEKIYLELKLPDFAKVKKAIEKYIATQIDYKKNTYLMDQRTNQRIFERWNCIINRLGYEPVKNSRW